MAWMRATNSSDDRLGRCLAEFLRDPLGALKIEPANYAESRADQHTKRFAGESRDYFFFFAGNLWPLAANALPNAVFGPPPAEFT